MYVVFLNFLVVAFSDFLFVACSDFRASSRMMCMIASAVSLRPVVHCPCLSSIAERTVVLAAAVECGLFRPKTV